MRSRTVLLTRLPQWRPLLSSPAAIPLRPQVLAHPGVCEGSADLFLDLCPERQERMPRRPYLCCYRYTYLNARARCWLPGKASTSPRSRRAVANARPVQGGDA